MVYNGISRCRTGVRSGQEKVSTALAAGLLWEPLKWWIFKAFFVGVGFWERRNGHLRTAGSRAAELFPGMPDIYVWI